MCRWLVIVVLISGSASFAHDQWLETEPTTPLPGNGLKLYLQVGEHLSQAELAHLKSKSRYTRFSTITAKGRKDLLATLREDTQPIAVLPFDKASTVVVLDSSPRLIELEAGKFAAYLLEERLIGVLAQRVERGEENVAGREKYSRSMKLLLLGADDAVVTTPVGQDLELVPTTRPRHSKDTLTLQVLFKGKPLPRAAITVANRLNSDLRTQSLRTDADGRVTVSFARPGDWFFGLVHMERSAEPDCDWRSYWSSLTFQVE